MTTKRQTPESWAHQERAMEFIRSKPGAMLAMEMGTGKDLDDDTPIATTEGWTRMGDLQPSQHVFDECGQPCAITAVYPQGRRLVYEVTFDDGAVLTAGDEHLWVTLTNSLRHRIHQDRAALENWASCLLPITTAEIRRSLTHQRGTLIESQHSIPVTRPLSLPEAELPLDPYLLGLWLGDGSSWEAAITCHQDNEPHHRTAAAGAGESWRIRNRSGSALTCTMAHGPDPRVRTRPKGLGIFGSREIPPAYLRADTGQRTRLIQGLMDQGGYIDPRNGAAQFTSTSEKLAHGFLELALSLGQKATMTCGEATLEGQVISPKWNVQFTPSIQVASLPRKAETLEPFLQLRSDRALGRTDQRYIRTVEPAGVRRTTCITVDSPSGLFLAGRELIPTHNTRGAVNLMDELEARRTLVMAPLSVVDHVWPREIRLHGSRPNITIIPLGDKLTNVREKLRAATEGLALASARTDKGM